jgi:tRNA threonylcarbamoyladenosine biosynthesis protein TsaB
MIILGIDTATSATAVALAAGEGAAARELRDDPAPGAHPGHATRLLAMADELLRAEGVSWREVQRIAVGLGPGAFTGLRVGAATARSLAQSLGAELVGVSSALALAHGALVAGAPAALGGPGTGAPDRLLAVIDARRGEVFAAAYELGAREGLVELAAPAPLPPQQLAAMLARLGPHDGHESGQAPAARAPAGAGAHASVGGWLAVGDGALAYESQVLAAGAQPAPRSSPLHRIAAASICALGALAQAGTALEQVLPDYRRRPDAELALEAAAAGGSAR